MSVFDSYLCSLQFSNSTKKMLMSTSQPASLWIHEVLWGSTPGNLSLRCCDPSGGITSCFLACVRTQTLSRFPPLPVDSAVLTFSPTVATLRPERQNCQHKHKRLTEKSLQGTGAQERRGHVTWQLGRNFLVTCVQHATWDASYQLPLWADTSAAWIFNPAGCSSRSACRLAVNYLSPPRWA